MYIGTAIGGAVFPRTRREVYQTSPIAKYKVGPVPLITICGLIAAGFSAWMLYWYITEPFLGIANLSAGFDGVKSLLIMVAIFVGWTAYYFVRRAYLRSRGINLHLAYKEVPPISATGSAGRELIAQHAVPLEVDDRSSQGPRIILRSRVDADSALELGRVLRLVDVPVETEDRLGLEDRGAEGRAADRNQDLLSSLH